MIQSSIDELIHCLLVGLFAAGALSLWLSGRLFATQRAELEVLRDDESRPLLARAAYLVTCRLCLSLWTTGFLTGLSVVLGMAPRTGSLFWWPATAAVCWSFLFRE